MSRNDSPEDGINTREIVLDILLRLEREPEYSHRLIKAVLDRYRYLPVQERAFIKRLAEGSIERRIELDYVIDCFSSVPVKKMKPLIRSLMRMSVYQILYMDGIPDSAACNEAVKLAGKRKFHNLKGFVNGSLRNISKQKQQICYPDRETQPVRYASIRYSMPEWLVQKWNAEYGSEQTEQILEGLLAVRPVSLRVAYATPEAKRQEWFEQTEKTGVVLKRHPLSGDCFLAENLEHVSAIPGFYEGFFTVQDYSSVLAVKAAGIQPEDVVVDICAAPGGKSILASQMTEGKGRVLARDVSERKAEQIREAALRMKAENLTVQVFDATHTDESLSGCADVLLADVPCSGLGVIGKKRDIKYRITPEALEEVNALQKQILAASLSYVKPGGTLLYSTCTVNKQENEEMTEWICQNFPFEPESLNAYIPEELHSETTKRGYLQLLPGQCDCDGFFFARLKRKKEEKQDV